MKEVSGYFLKNGDVFKVDLDSPYEYVVYGNERGFLFGCSKQTGFRSQFCRNRIYFKF